MKKGIYDDGYIINYKDGDRSLQRDPLEYREDVDDELYTLREGDTLTSIAYRFYRDPLKWYIISDVNQIENPFDLEVGRDIVIPNSNKYD